jgi:uncharacterized protein YbjT (DUF2867 family)
MQANPVLVIGATGRIGRAVVAELRSAGVSVRALTRRPAEANLPTDVEIVAGDLTVPESLDVPLRDVETAFLVWTAAPATVPQVVERLAANVRRVVLLTSPHQTPHPFFQQSNPMAAMHASIERELTRSGVVTTFIRPGMFASNVLHWWAPSIRAGNTVRWPYADAETAPIDERDIAAVIARVLRDDTHAGGDYVLTGPDSLSQREQVAIIGDAIGRRIEFAELSPDEFRSETAATWPPRVVEMLMDAWKATLGHKAYVTTAVSDILGVPARSFHQWAVDHAAAFQKVQQ